MFINTEDGLGAMSDIQFALRKGTHARYSYQRHLYAYSKHYWSFDGVFVIINSRKFPAFVFMVSLYFTKGVSQMNPIYQTSFITLSVYYFKFTPCDYQSPVYKL
jgi:hypothetical protein